jgi:hypothetical protein
VSPCRRPRCTVYAERPNSCRTFYCLWKQAESLGPEWKPDKAKFFVHLQENTLNLLVRVDPSFPNAWMRNPYYGRIKGGRSRASSAAGLCSCASNRA